MKVRLRLRAMVWVRCNCGAVKINLYDDGDSGYVLKRRAEGLSVWHRHGECRAYTADGTMAGSTVLRGGENGADEEAEPHDGGSE